MDRSDSTGRTERAIRSSFSQRAPDTATTPTGRFQVLVDTLVWMAAPFPRARRSFLLGVAFALLAAACSGGGRPHPPPPPSRPPPRPPRGGAPPKKTQKGGPPPLRQGHKAPARGRKP